MCNKTLAIAARHLPRTSSIAAPQPRPDAGDVLAHFFPQPPADRAIRVFRDICLPVVHYRR